MHIEIIKCSLCLFIVSLKIIRLTKINSGDVKSNRLYKSILEKNVGKETSEGIIGEKRNRSWLPRLIVWVKAQNKKPSHLVVIEEHGLFGLWTNTKK